MAKKTPTEATNSYLELESSPIQLQRPADLAKSKERFTNTVFGRNLQEAPDRARIFMQGYAWYMFRKIAEKLSQNQKIKFVKRILTSPQLLYDDMAKLL